MIRVYTLVALFLGFLLGITLTIAAYKDASVLVLSCTVLAFIALAIWSEANES